MKQLKFSLTLNFADDITPEDALVAQENIRYTLNLLRDNKMLAPKKTNETSVQVAMFEDFTEVQLEKLGAKIAEVFCMQERRLGNWHLTTGTKTDIGLARTFLRMADEIPLGDFSSLT